MALIALVARDGIAQVYDGRHNLAFPGIVVQPDGQEDWVAGDNVLHTEGLRFRLEDADAEAYWVVLAEGLLGLRAVGVSNVVVGMSEAEFERIGRDVGRLIKAQCGGRVSVLHGDHFALFSLEPWSGGDEPDDSRQTIFLRVGAQRVQAIRLIGGNVVEQCALQPGWDEAVLGPAVARAFDEGRRQDLHDLAWEMFSTPAADDLSAFAGTMLNHVAAVGWTGQLIIAGPAGGFVAQAMQQVIQRERLPWEMAPQAAEIIGLWNLARLQGLGP